MKPLQKIAEKINEGNKFSAQAGTKYLYVCKNNGQFHKGNGNNTPGYASFVGRMTINEAQIWASEYIW